MPIASLWAPSATYSFRSAGSDPSTIPTTLVAGSVVASKRTSPWTAGPVSPGRSWSSGLPNSLGTDAVGRKIIRGWVTPGGICSPDGRLTLGERNCCSKVPMSGSIWVMTMPEMSPMRPLGERSGASSEVFSFESLRKTTSLPRSSSRDGSFAVSAMPPAYRSCAPSIDRAGISNVGW